MPRYPRKSRVFKPHVRVPAPKRRSRRRLRPPRHYMGRELDRDVSDISAGEAEEHLDQEYKRLAAALQAEGAEETEITPPPEVAPPEEDLAPAEPAVLEPEPAEEVSFAVEPQELEGVEQPEPSLAVESVEAEEVEPPSVAHLTQDDIGEQEFVPVETSLAEVDIETPPVSPPEIEESVEPQFAQAELPDIEEPASVRVDTEDYAYDPEVRLAEPLDLDLDYAAEFEGVQPLELDEAVSEPARISDLVDLQELEGGAQFASVPSEEFEVPDIELPRSDHEELLQYADYGRVHSPAERFQDFQPRNFVRVPDIA